MSGTELRTFDFHGDEIVTLEARGVRYVAMRRICENMGLAWEGQRPKLLEQKEKFDCHDIMAIGADGRQREMLCMPVEKLPLWLASINPNKIKDPTIRAKIERYQAECAVALHNYWTKGAAIRGDLDGIVTGLEPSVMKAIGGMLKGIVHKQLVEIIPELIRSEIASGEFSIGKGYTSGQVIDLAKVPGAEGLKGLDRFVSNRVDSYHRRKGILVREGSLGKRRARLFDPATCREWLANGGKEEIQRRVNERKGQTVLTFPKAKGAK